ncbi:MAG: ribbon-helix-helix protein, CopG family [Actinobacteria bacterium]|nr:ribbon-helix-helix protein, CopG family [Actinomycetota bacterium]
MRRTQIYITEEQDRRLVERAKDAGISKAEAIRRVLDRALDAGDPEAEAHAIIEATSGICANYPGWREWQGAVRGRSADERLRGAGL